MRATAQGPLEHSARFLDIVTANTSWLKAGPPFQILGLTSSVPGVDLRHVCLIY